MATHPQSKKFASLSDAEKRRRISAGEKSGRMSGAEATKARKFWGLAPPRTPSRDATVFGAESTLAPWDVRPPPKASPPPRTIPFKKGTPMYPLTGNIPSRLVPGSHDRLETTTPGVIAGDRAAALRAARYAAAQRSVLNPKARQFLADTLTPKRREQLLRADVLPQPPPPPRRNTESFLPDANERRMFLHGGWNPLNPVAAVGGYLGRHIEGEAKQMGDELVRPVTHSVYDWLFPVGSEERADNAEVLANGLEATARWGAGAGAAINHALGHDSGALEQAGIPVPQGLKNVIKSTVTTSAQALVGIGPGTVAMAIHPEAAAHQMKAQYQDYYGRLLNGDWSVLEEQGVTQIMMDALGLTGSIAGGAARLRAFARTSAFLRDGEIPGMTGAEARYRALSLGQEPVQTQSGKWTMGVAPHVRHIGRDAPVRKGETIEEGDRVHVRNREGTEQRTIVATKENGLAGKEAPDVNDSYRHTLPDGEKVDVVGATTSTDFVQRMPPRSTIGRVISDGYWSVRGGTGKATREGLDLRPSGAGMRARHLRREGEHAEDRTYGAMRQFRADHKEIQKDTVLATAYDRLLRYPDPVEGIAQEIVARRQRGGVDETGKQGQKWMAALEQAGEVVKDPPPNLMAAAWAGKMLADDTTQFLIRRGMLSPDVAERSEFAAQRWLKPGHLRDEPLDSPRRSEVEDVIREHYGENADLAMAHTDTLARAWGEREGRNPADWYDEFINKVETAPDERLEAIHAANPRQVMRQYRRTPTFRDTFALRDPLSGDMRVARLVDWLGTEEDLGGRQALVEWTREPDAGMRFTVPAEEVMGNTSQIHGWYSGISIEAEKLRDKVSKQEVHAKLSKAPGVKADEWKWMGMEKIIDDLFAGAKSRSREDVVRAIKANALRFETEHLDIEQAYYETQHGVTLPGPYYDYSETLIYWPERLHQSQAEWSDIHDAWHEHELANQEAAEAAGDEHYEPDPEVPQWFAEEFEQNNQPQPLYTSPHFDGRGWGDSDSEGHDMNLLAHLRQSGRWVEGKPIRVSEEYQSDWHQAAGETYRDSEGNKRRVGYRTEEGAQAEARAQEKEFSTDRARRIAEREHSDQMRQAVDERDVPVRVLTTGDEGIIRKGKWGEIPHYRVEHVIDAVPDYLVEGMVTARRRMADAIEARARAIDKGLDDVALEPVRHEVDLADYAIQKADAAVHRWEEGRFGYARDAHEREIGRYHESSLEPVDPDLRESYNTAQQAHADWEDARREHNQARSQNRGPAEAPYSEARWEELLFREHVRQAVANGETRVAWTTGKQQAERYNSLLAAKVRKIEYDGESLYVEDAAGQGHTYPIDDDNTLSGMVGASMAKNLEKQLEVLPKFDPKLFRVDRPVGQDKYGMAQMETMHIPITEMEDGDHVWVGYPSDEHMRRPQMFVVEHRVPPGKVGEVRYFHPRGYTRAGEHEWHGVFDPVWSEGGIDGGDFGWRAEKIQKEQYERYGEKRGGSVAVLEGENIQVGGGGFVDAYDRRQRAYAKRYLGEDSNPRQLPVDDLNFDAIIGPDQRHPQYEEGFAEFNRLVDDPNTPGGEDSGELVKEAFKTIAPIYRVKAGDTILAESESLQAALQAAKQGGTDRGFWPSRVVHDPEDGMWYVTNRGGKPGDTIPMWEVRQADGGPGGNGAWETHQSAVASIDARYQGHWDDTFDHEETRVYTGGAPNRTHSPTGTSRDNPGPVWVADIPDKLAADLHERGSSLFQRRRGHVYGLAHLTEEGADIYLNATRADIATWVEESAHAVIPDWFDAADARGDARANHIREQHLEMQPGEPIDNLANERVVRAFQAWLHRGAMGAPQQRELLHGLSEEMKEAYYKRGAISPTDSGAAEIERMLDDHVVTSFFRDAFDPAPYKDLDPGTVAFSTMKTRTKVRRTTGERLQTTVRSINPSRKNLAKQKNTMRAWETGQFDVGPDVTAHYAAAEARMRAQDELALRLKRYDEPIEIVDGLPILKPGYRVYNYHGIRGAQVRLDKTFRASERYGEIKLADSEEPLLSADPAAGGIDLDAIDFLEASEEMHASIFSDEMLYKSVSEAAAKVGDSFLEKVRKGQITQIPEDVAHAFERRSGATFSLGAVSNMTRALSALLAIPSMMARWRMVGKFAYPILNAVQTGILIGINQGPALAFSVKAAFDLSAGTRYRLMTEIGLGTADIATHTPEIYGILEKARRAEQSGFRYVMTALSQPEARIRLLQMINDLRRAGVRGEEDTVALLDAVKAGDEKATKLLNHIARQAEDAVVNFRGLAPEEQFVVRDAIFVYGWLRAATRFTLQFPLNRPVTSAAMFNVGQMGWQQLQNDFFPLAREQSGALPIGQKKMLDGFARKIVDVNQLLPFSTAKNVLDPILTLMHLEDGGLRKASIADMLSPSMELALDGVYSGDPRYGTDPIAALLHEVDPRELPGVLWAVRLIDPASTGSKLREPYDRAGVVTNLFLGMLAPQEIRESVSYARWLNQQPQGLRTIIRETNTAATFAQYAQTAAQVDGEELDAETVRAINADSSYKAFASLYEHKWGSINDTERAAVKAEVLKHYYPEAYSDGVLDVQGVDYSTEEGAAEYQQAWGDLYDESVSNVNKETKARIKDVLNQDVPSTAKEPNTLDQITNNWLRAAPQDSIDRLRKKTANMNDPYRIREAVLHEMQAASTP